MGRRILAISAAVVIALVGAFLVLLYARSADQRALAAQSPTDVYVSSQAVPAGTSLRDAVRTNLLTQTKVPSAALPAGALTAIDETNAALVALTDIPPGEYILAAAFGEIPLGEKAIQVPAGELAVSVQLSDPARVGTFVRPGSHLTIFATHEADTGQSTSSGSTGTNGSDSGGGAASTGPTTQVLLPDVLVIAMGASALTPGQVQVDENGQPVQQQQQQGQGFLVTVAVSPKDAARLVHGINNFSLYAGLRGDEVDVKQNLSTDDSTVFKG
jgi:pilus assembly protein CpaB